MTMIGEVCWGIILQHKCAEVCCVHLQWQAVPVMPILFLEMASADNGRIGVDVEPEELEPPTPASAEWLPSHIIADLVKRVVRDS